MARYIDAEEIRIELERLTLINNLTQRQDDVTEEYKSVHKGMTSAYNHCRNIILDAPTADVVEVVRCSECKHLNVLNLPTLYAYCEKARFRFEAFEMDTRTHFCSYGEKKE